MATLRQFNGLRAGGRGGKIATGDTTWSLSPVGESQKEENYQTNPILRRPAWKSANGKAKNEANCRIRQRYPVRLGCDLGHYVVAFRGTQLSGCCTTLISLMDKVLEAQVCHFVTLVRLAKDWVRFGCLGR